MRFFRIEENKELLGGLEIFEYRKSREGDKRSDILYPIEIINPLTKETTRRIKDEARILLGCTNPSSCVIYTEFGRVVDIHNQIPEGGEMYLTVLRNIVRYNSIYSPDENNETPIDQRIIRSRIILMKLVYTVDDEHPRYIEVTVVTHRELCNIMEKPRKMKIMFEGMIPMYLHYTLLDGFPHIEFVTDSFDRDDLYDKFFINQPTPKRLRHSYSMFTEGSALWNS